MPKNQFNENKAGQNNRRIHVFEQAERPDYGAGRYFLCGGGGLDGRFFTVFGNDILCPFQSPTIYVLVDTRHENHKGHRAVFVAFMALVISGLVLFA